MRAFRCLVVVGTIILLGAEEPKKDATEEDLKLMQGTWELIGRELGGVEMPSKQLKGETWVFEKNKLMIRINGKIIQEETFNLDASKEPKWFDTDDEGHRTLGIYRILSKEAMTICWGPLDGKDRPTEFTTKDKVGVRIHRLRRVKE